MWEKKTLRFSRRHSTGFAHNGSESFDVAAARPPERQRTRRAPSSAQATAQYCSRALDYSHDRRPVAYICVHRHCHNDVFPTSTADYETSGTFER